VDALASNMVLLQQYQDIFKRWQKLNQECTILKEQKFQFDREADYNQFQFNELDEAGFKQNELEEIEADLKMLNNSEGIKTVLDKVYFELDESESPVVQQVRTLSNQLQQFSDYHPDLPAILQRMQSAYIELQDVAGEIGRINDHINFDPARIESLNDRLSLGYKLLKKHGVQTTGELLAIREQLQEKLQAVLNIDEQIQSKEKETTALMTDAEAMAKKISVARQKQAKPFEENVNRLLAQVGMPNARLKVEISPGKELSFFGSDRVEFMFNANLPRNQAGDTTKTVQFQPIRKVASGGELSRLMLSIKSLVAKSIDLPTLIFDEIDTGISGEAAKQVGIILKELAAKRQVICITHQPQIAGKADSHFFVYKEIVKDVVKTGIRQLSNEERITAIAKMLGGEKPTAAALENAREMVAN
jgi:DNA repair protein RecN (Recombination protein N)